MNTDNFANSEVALRPWYKEPWLWLVIMLPVSSVIAGISTVIIAYQHADDLVNDDYYKVGISINQNIEAEKLAISYGLQGRLFFSGQRVQLQLQSEYTTDNILPEKLVIELFHPTLKKEDIYIELHQESPGLYAAQFNNSTLTGRRYLRITPFAKNWSFKQEIVVELGETVILDVR